MVARASNSGAPRNGLLSKREREVLALIAQGLTNKNVAQKLGISVHAVKFHLATVYRKLDVANRTEATVVYLTSLQDVPEIPSPVSAPTP